jgi:hypothetical protein
MLDCPPHNPPGYTRLPNVISTQALGNMQGLSHFCEKQSKLEQKLAGSKNSCNANYPNDLI